MQAEPLFALAVFFVPIFARLRGRKLQNRSVLLTST